MAYLPGFSRALGVALLSAAALQRMPNLPPPYATPSAGNPPTVVPRPAGAQLHVPQGFRIEEYASGFQTPRFMALGPGGEILLADSLERPGGSVWILTGKTRKKLMGGLDHPYGLAFWKNYLYVGEETSVKRYLYDAKGLTAGRGEEIVRMPQATDGHWTRTIAFSPDGTKMFLAVGSNSNDATGEPAIRAAISRFNPDGTGQEIFASGLRNPVGLRFYPGTAVLWTTVNERDGLGDDLPPDYLTHVEQGRFYGWPYAYIGPHPDPRNGRKRPDLVKKTTVPDVLLGPHVAPLDFIFYTGTGFPQRYRGGALVAEHGSWNRAQRDGYKLVFVPFQNGKPAGPPEDFVTGWMISPERKDVWGRPVGVLEFTDGSVLMTDDGGGKIWRISYEGRR